MAGQTGLTIRDYFAAKAMQGMAADGSFIWSSPEEDAALCYKVADAMLAARESKP